MTENAINISHVSKKYGRTTVLNNVSLSAKRGEIFGLIGPDGAGKTSLFRIMATLLLPDEGSVSVDGFDVITQTKEIRKRIGYMPGKFSLYQDLTVEENLRFFAKLFDITIDESYESIKAIYGQIEPFKNRKAGALSGGMKQKLALSCALIHQPKVLFLDEPTTGVDPISRKELWQMLLNLKERGITIMASTPYIDEVRLCERVAFINQGVINGIGSPDEILTKFADVFNPKGLKRNLIKSTKDVNSSLRAQRGNSVMLSSGLPRCARNDDYVIKVEHLVKAFGTLRAVDDISFAVKKGEIFGFLGANGAGKTTVMRMLTGLNQPTSGHATVAGFDVSTQYEQIKKHIGYMSQRFSLYEDMTVRQNTRLFGGIYGMTASEIKTKTTAMLERLGLTEHKDAIVSSLPLGWKQRLAFSVSILHEPEVVFLDEPTGGVDPATRKQFWQLIYDASERGITVFVTTHYMDEAEYCDRISIMVDGKIRALGSPAQLKEEYNCADIDGVFTLLARQSNRI